MIISPSRVKSTGFTLVELAVVIASIGILAAIAITSYSSMQAKARDTTRNDSISKIKEALEVYYTRNGIYPTATSQNPANGGWETSDDPAGTFLEKLYGYGVDEKTLDPLNKKVDGKDYRISYYRYAAGSDGCPVAKGAFYVLRVNFEQDKNRPPYQDATGICTPGKSTWFATNPTMYIQQSFETN